MSNQVVYISIGNSDDKLGQRAWSEFCDSVEVILLRCARVIHGNWASDSRDPYQNACWCVEPWPHLVEEFKDALARMAGRFHQDSIAWAEASTEFINPSREERS